MKTRIMYIQGGWSSGRIGRVRLSKTGRTLNYGDIELAVIGGRGYKSSHFDTATGETYWISGPRKDGQDTLYSGVVEIDADVPVEYWRDVRGEPDRRDTTYRSTGVHGNRATREIRSRTRLHPPKPQRDVDRVVERPRGVVDDRRSTYPRRRGAISGGVEPY